MKCWTSALFFVPLLQITAQKMKFSIQDFFSKCHQSRRKPRILLHLLKKSLMEIFIICAVNTSLVHLAIFSPMTCLRSVLVTKATDFLIGLRSGERNAILNTNAPTSSRAFSAFLAFWSGQASIKNLRPNE